MAGFTHLFIPGPTNIPEQVRQAMNLPMEDMRAGSFPDFTLPLFEDIKKVFKNETGRVFIYPSSGTGAWEAAMTNVLSPGDRVLMSRFGQFSHLWVDMAERLGFEVDVIDCEWGTGVPLELYAERLKADKAHRIKAVFCTQNETATGVTSDVAGCRAALDDGEPPCPALRRRRVVDRLDRFPPGGMGRRLRRQRLAEGLHAARRPRLPVGQQEGARRVAGLRPTGAASSPSRT